MHWMQKKASSRHVLALLAHAGAMISELLIIRMVSGDVLLSFFLEGEGLCELAVFAEPENKPPLQQTRATRQSYVIITLSFIRNNNLKTAVL